jgi:hypothetical protein
VSLERHEGQGENVDQEAAAQARQKLRRHVNDRIEEITETLHVAPPSIDVMCECVRADCQGLISMRLVDYRAVRSIPNRYVVKAGHELTYDERLVADAEDRVLLDLW